MLEIHFGDNLEVLRAFPDHSFDLIYIDPPFNTGRQQRRDTLRTTHSPTGERVGFGGRRYAVTKLGSRAFGDVFDDYLAFLEPRLVAAQRLLRARGSFFLHLDYREVHYAKVLCDAIFGRECFQNEIIWAYDYGGRSKRRWSAKHDNILWYSANPQHYTYRYDSIDRIPYMAPRLVGPEKAARGKTPTDCWWQTIVSPTSREKTGYPTQKPLAIVERIIKVHSEPGDRVLDFFAGSGTLGAAAAAHGRHATLVDNNREAIEVMYKRLAFAEPRVFGWSAPPELEPEPEPDAQAPGEPPSEAEPKPSAAGEASSEAGEARSEAGEANSEASEVDAPALDGG